MPNLTEGIEPSAAARLFGDVAPVELTDAVPRTRGRVAGGGMLRRRQVFALDVQRVGLGFESPLRHERMFDTGLTRRRYK
jgi:hypothetical protein